MWNLLLHPPQTFYLEIDMILRSLFAFAFVCATTSALADSREVLTPGQSIRLGDVTVECRQSGGGGDQCPTDGLNAAKALCNEFNTWAGTDACLAAIRNARFFNVEAVSLCRGYNTWAGTQNCLNATQDREYTSAEISGCNSRPTWDATTTCLTNSGRPSRCW